MHHLLGVVCVCMWTVAGAVSFSHLTWIKRSHLLRKSHKRLITRERRRRKRLIVYYTALERNETNGKNDHEQKIACELEDHGPWHHRKVKFGEGVASEIPINVINHFHGYSRSQASCTNELCRKIALGGGVKEGRKPQNRTEYKRKTVTLFLTKPQLHSEVNKNPQNCAKITQKP